MNLKQYLKDNIVNICIYATTLIILFLFFRILKLTKEVIISTYTILLISGITMVLYNYYRKVEFYNKFLKKLKEIEKKYIITEMITRPSFIEGEILYDAIYEINKALFKQIGIFFLFPLALSIIHSIAGIQVGIDMAEGFGKGDILISTIITTVFIILIYGGYFLISYYSSKNNVRWDGTF